jgi:hypothetical protein
MASFDNNLYTVIHSETLKDGTHRGIVEGRYKTREEAEEVAKRVAISLNKFVRIYYYYEVCEVYPTGRTVWWTR